VRFSSSATVQAGERVIGSFIADRRRCQINCSHLPFSFLLYGHGPSTHSRGQRYGPSVCGGGVPGGRISRSRISVRRTSTANMPPTSAVTAVARTADNPIESKHAPRNTIAPGQRVVALPTTSTTGSVAPIIQPIPKTIVVQIGRIRATIQAPPDICEQSCTSISITGRPELPRDALRRNRKVALFDELRSRLKVPCPMLLSRAMEASAPDNSVYTVTERHGKNSRSRYMDSDPEGVPTRLEVRTSALFANEFL
jgi:hypothetical protein